MPLENATDKQQELYDRIDRRRTKKVPTEKGASTMDKISEISDKNALQKAIDAAERVAKAVEAG